jgi:hypothetical protein
VTNLSCRWLWGWVCGHPHAVQGTLPTEAITSRSQCSQQSARLFHNCVRVIALVYLRVSRSTSCTHWCSILFTIDAPFADVRQRGATRRLTPSHRPQEVKASEDVLRHVRNARRDVSRILQGKDDRLVSETAHTHTHTHTHAHTSPPPPPPPRAHTHTHTHTHTTHTHTHTHSATITRREFKKRHLTMHACAHRY